MAETKRNAARRLSNPSNPRTAMVLAHGSYASRESFNVPNGIVIIFVSRTARYLPQSVINSEFYSVFTRKGRLHNILSNKNSVFKTYDISVEMEEINKPIGLIKLTDMLSEFIKLQKK
jgi:hypothetical protein